MVKHREQSAWRKAAAKASGEGQAVPVGPLDEFMWARRAAGSRVSSSM